MKVITLEELFGSHGIIPLELYTGVGNAVCPHCKRAIRNINFPPPGVIIVHSCPLCGELVLPFLKNLVAVQKKVLDSNQTIARMHLTECLFNTITPVLMDVVEQKLCSEKVIKDFLDDCWEIVYILVGEKEDSETFLNKLKMRAKVHRGDRLGRVFEDYFDHLSHVFKSSIMNKAKQAITLEDTSREDPITKDDVTNVKIDLYNIESVDDFLKKFGDSSK